MVSCGSNEGGGKSNQFTIGPQGGEASSPDGKATVLIPSGALSQEVVITVEEVSNPLSGSIGKAYQFGPSGTNFIHPVSISILYNESDIPSSLDESSLRVAKLQNNAWEEIDEITVDSVSNTVGGSTNNFSIFGLIAVDFLS